MELDKTGKFVFSKEVVEPEPPKTLFASKQKVVSEIRQEQVKQHVEPVEHVETVQESKVEQPVMEEPLVQEVINEVAEELKVEEVLASETVSTEETVVEVSSVAETTLGFSKKKSKKKN
jgi:myo-inositol-1-phosphate synthase